MIADLPYEQDITIMLHHLDETGLYRIPMAVQLIYDPRDPCAVELLFPDTGERGNSWIIARDLLVQGIESSAGEGDVQVATYGLVTEDVTVLTLAPDADARDFTLSTDELIRFLLISEELVPIGLESSLVQAELDEGQWLRSTRPGTVEHD